MRKCGSSENKEWLCCRVVYAVSDAIGNVEIPKTHEAAAEAVSRELAAEMPGAMALAIGQGFRLVHISAQPAPLCGVLSSEPTSLSHERSLRLS